jgi:CheY-like chemotaxis protein
VESGQLILVVDSKQTGYEEYVLKELLQRYDFDAHVVTSGEDALKAFRTIKFAAVLVGTAISDMDGCECTERLRRVELEQERPRTPIIGLTSRADQREQRCVQAGIDAFISKPFEQNELRRALLRYVHVIDFSDLNCPEATDGDATAATTGRN